ncbi:MAG: methionine--tRNA ligase [Acidimicrobiia bacterium]|nr:methionine--tRNA ligase [Acidimicrobiia bacterium]MDH5238899.1 methionine--tRNA ligase [Acidimicrobiia bacterium]
MPRIYLTTPIYYVNDVPHVGHAYTTLNADAVARWHRLLGDDVYFLTGTDEHGLKIQRSAEENGLSPIEQADRTSVRFRETWELLDISNDDFIRTTEHRHHVAVQELLTRAYDNGYIEKNVYEGAYCVSCEAYYTDDELVEGNCPIHKRPVEQMSEDNYFFRLSAFADRLEAWLTDTPDAITPDGYRNEALGLIRQGLDDVSISRTSITWGVPVPWDEGHVFYVWYDALINYATAVGFGADPERFETWWPATHHVLGKDILRFHCVYWPAMLLAAGIEPLPRFHVHGFLLVGGEKMSKTGINKIAPAELVADFGVDGFRYALLRDNSFGPDSEFSYEALLGRYNSDLANNYGNLVQRVCTVVVKQCGGVGPPPRPDSPLAVVATAAYRETAEAWDRFQPAVALDATWRLIRETNEFLARNEPWKMEPGPEVDAIMGDALEALRIVCILASPAVPTASATAWARIGMDGAVGEQRLPEAAEWGQYPGGSAIGAGDPLFPRLKA